MARTWKWGFFAPCALVAWLSFLAGLSEVADWSIAWSSCAFFAVLADFTYRFARRAARREAESAARRAADRRQWETRQAREEELRRAA